MINQACRNSDDTFREHCPVQLLRAAVPNMKKSAQDFEKFDANRLRAELNGIETQLQSNTVKDLFTTTYLYKRMDWLEVTLAKMSQGLTRAHVLSDALELIDPSRQQNSCLTGPEIVELIGDTGRRTVSFCGSLAINEEQRDQLKEVLKTK